MRRRTTYLAAALLAAPLFAQQPPAPMEAQQRPVFRGGTHFVRVDAYPTTSDGKIVEHLRAEDFEIFEDGKPQAVESFDFVKFETFNPVIERRDPRSQQEGFDMAADPRYRVFVIVVNINSSGIWYMQKPLVSFLNRVLGRNDLFGLMSTRQTAHDLVLGQSTTTAEAEIADFWRSSEMDRTPSDDALDGCGPPGEAVKGLHALDQTYVTLETLVQQLGSLRQERKNVIFVSNALQSPRPARAIREAMPTPMPKVGITNGRVGIGEHADGRPSDNYCTAEILRLTSIDFWNRFTDLLRDAKRANVAFYTITPAGLQAPMADAARSDRPPNVRAELDRINRNNDSLLTLSNETDGVAIVNTNDLEGGMRKIADDLSAYYVLGYYTTNTKWDGGVRRIKVRDRKTGKEIRARREYRAPTAEEIAALSRPPAPPKAPSPEQQALNALSRPGQAKP
jgi:VWFA-related protein